MRARVRCEGGHDLVGDEEGTATALVGGILDDGASNQVRAGVRLGEILITLRHPTMSKRMGVEACLEIRGGVRSFFG